ncbi:MULTISPECIES: UDP-N-acetylglucosamine 2-epimerase (non-hydrolyzing) [unclassified Pseudoalteromonas]|uniref:non-hydrolyzing UDP-N-acetylglucosamine 2-epimerase n=1 Tax=unclassified Pseudoalteromonas TaxID=194690 RepID=UPI0025B4C16E|nr:MULTISPECIES: UDP-N-acetylglucosamine 2-epimerase (non-hydrolyzing) [unclassified Pseudoalteromonas]MDN3408125.1 UDP-N-acetylglucosamine 2-epimerase (non-hydrolyzing) [Pseudoalteromonas sp. APC 3894]MDN3415765.1 UDP-N-acetylglucosamine 2-epimerase (non-hydrolyzing) [Pseudoalteromonas sp. APC 3227]MDN3419463.1 UDP-N-acetylglucosamine 2-epimerase (non-hydrolyzing) [Pseudoalteromonas sp. APC 3895]MDN3422832.1 UDP-N-acetylglucosamine 2-epimerase (non-hydrolyzing) [Pseudoalteromonas sp. APC 3896]
MTKVVTILGARPQFIKAGSVSREFAKYDNFKEIIVHTGQHYDANMSDVFFDEMKIPKPDYFLGIGGKSHGAMTGQMIEKIEEVLLSEKPDWVLVYGDTNSTLAGSIAASKLHIKVAHIEAGLRSFNMKMPEEVNRILTDRISSILFCPTQTAIDNLQSEGVDKWNTQVELSGDVMQDGAIFYRELAEKPPGLTLDSEFILSTIHRAENTDSEIRLTAIVESLNEIAEQVAIVLPLHPRTKIKLEALPIKLSSRIKLIDPVGYLNMVWLIDNCKLVMTDSGGLQKEAFFFEKPCITLRDETEWVELVEHNFNVLVGADKARIITTFTEHTFSNDFNIDLYGNGFASNNIATALINYEK